MQFMEAFLFLLLSLARLQQHESCSDFYMNFSDPQLRLSVRTLDLGLQTTNWTLTAWPVGSKIDFSSIPPMSIAQHFAGSIPTKYGIVGVTANWVGDERWGFPSFFADSMNDQGLSCSLLTLVNSEYEGKSLHKTNVFAGSFCKCAMGGYANVKEVMSVLDSIVIYGPNALDQHFILRDASGASLVIEMVAGKKKVYLDLNDGIETFGITTNEPTLDWHLQNIKHYEWKRTLARQAVPVPGNWYPDERFLRVHMVKSGMQSLMETTRDFSLAFSLAAQVLNTVSVPMGSQYGTDSGASSGEGDEDHTVFGVIRDHVNPSLYWRDNTNPTFRRISLKDVFSDGNKFRQMKLESGPFFVDMSSNLV